MVGTGMVMGLNFPVHIAVPCVYGFLMAKCRFYFVLSGDLNSLGTHNERLDAKTNHSLPGQSLALMIALRWTIPAFRVSPGLLVQFD
ncbi:hypothetical protein BDV32DRAFT_3993 [Aspergillus pseudonomiae]|nr:hypothetical protein BDV32DRAFT_3993 [Aspergillus pseudonomiae]